MKNNLTLKWGTLKAWNFGVDKKGQKLLKEYHKLGASMSAMTQKDTPRQKEIICELIDLVDEKIYLDWDGKYVSQKKAKEYVMNYNNN